MRRYDLKNLMLRRNVRLAHGLSKLPRGQKMAILLILDMAMVPLAYVLVKLLATGTLIDRPMGIAIMTLTGGLASFFLGLARIKLSTYEQSGILRTACYGLTVGLVGLFTFPFLYGTLVDPIVFLTFTLGLIVMSVSGRFLLRRILVAIYTRGIQRQRILIYGAGQTGVQLAAALDSDGTFDPVAFIDDNKSLQKVLVSGRTVYSPVGIQSVLETEAISRVVLAIPSVSRPRQARLAAQFESFGCEVSTLPSFASLVSKKPITDTLLPADPASFLNRKGLDQELTGDGDIYSNSTVMITGAGGSIGAELSRQVLKYQPRALVLFDVSEHALYQLERELCDIPELPENCQIIPVLGSVTDAQHVERTLRLHNVSTVLHAAAYKHVTMVEKNLLFSLHNNIFGTRIVAKAAMNLGVANFILVSTDKAVHPTSVMGASKRFGELLIQDISSRAPNTRFAIVRFGNVLGSSGSVVPLFAEQIARGGPVTLTHNEVTRYFMTISEAARLVLIVGSQAQDAGTQGQVYLLDMGQPVLIRDLARKMIENAGYTVCDEDNPNGDIEITVQGLRQGEKLHERLAMDGHTVTKTNHPKIMSVDEERLSELEVASALRALTDAIDNGEERAALKMLERWISTPTHAISLTDRPTSIAT